MKQRIQLLAAFLAVLSFAALLWAQTPTGAIEGTVTDPAGAVVPRARVTVMEAETGRNIPLTTNDIGFYSARNLLPGRYSVKVEFAGFAAKELKDIVVNSGAVVNGSVALEIGKTGEVVEVSAQAISVDTTRQTVDSIIQAREIRDLPLFSRNFLDLAAIAPGVFTRDGESIDPTKAFAYRAVSISGSSGTGTRVQIDGIDVTDETVGTTTANVSNEAVSQFQLTRSSLDISTSLTSTGAINVISKSGTNQLHGSAFFDYYNQDLGARIQYNKEAEPFNRKRYGGGFGFPVLKDKLFGFVNWERTYQTSQTTNRTPEFPQYNISQGFPTGIRYGLGRVDWNVTPTVRAFGKFQYNWDISTGGTPISPFQNLDMTNVTTLGLDFSKGHSTHAIRFGYTNFNNKIVSQELTLKFPTAPGGTPFQLNVGPISVGPNGLAPQATFQDNYQLSYDGSYVWGRHTFRYGGSYTRIALGGFANFAGPLSINGTYDAGTIADLKKAGLDVTNPLNYPLDSGSLGPANGFFTLAAGHNLPHGDHINNRTAFFGGDNIKLTKNFTLNIGLRYEYDSGYFSNDRRVKREPLFDTWGKGFSQFPDPPKNMWSPSIGFAWDPTGRGKTSIRAGFYRAFEMNIFNNILFDEFSNLPAGIGPDSYDLSGVTGPDGTPINVDGKHPDGDYTDLVGQPIKNTLGLIERVNTALQAAYANYKFDPTKGQSAFVIGRGNVFGGNNAGNQFKTPYSIQANVGVQHELRPGTVLSVDYIFNHGVGLPFNLVDFERRRDAGTLNVAAARTKINSVLGGQTVDQYIASHPSSTIATFGLATDTIYQGLTSNFLRARFFQGGFTKYRALQVNLRGRVGNFMKLRDTQYSISYALGRAEATEASNRSEFLNNVQDNHNWNNPTTFGPTGLDYRHQLNSYLVLNAPGGFRINTLWRFRSVAPQSLFVPNLGGPVSSSNGIFGTDLNGDGGTGSGAPRGDPLPGANMGQFGRDVSSLDQLNQILQAFNQNYAGKITPAGQALVSAGLFTEAQLKSLKAVTQTIPLIPANAPNPWHNLFTTDLRFDRPIKFHGERFRATPFMDVINLFNHAPSGNYRSDLVNLLAARFGALNFDYVNASAGSQVSDLTFQRGRNTGTRQLQFGVRFDF
jgi:carboxypeptidase family protein/TonB-dependent receptor-like protein